MIDYDEQSEFTIMLRVERVTEHFEAFATFKRATSFSRILRAPEMTEINRLLIYSGLVLVTLGIFFSVDVPFSRWFGGKWSTWGQVQASLFWAEAFTAPIFMILLAYYSRRIKKHLSRRGIFVTGWFWNGTEIDKLKIESFTASMDEKGWLNRKSLSALIEAARDDVIAATRKPTLAYAVYAIVFGVIVGLCAPLIGKWFDLAIRTDADLIAALQLTLSLAIIIFGAAWFYLKNWVNTRTDLESYLQCLHSLRFSLPDLASPTPRKDEILKVSSPPGRTHHSQRWEMAFVGLRILGWLIGRRGGR